MDDFPAHRFTSKEKKGYTILMDPVDHLRITGSALKNWITAQIQDSLAVGLLWLAGLWVLHVPWAPFWAFLAAVFQFFPNLGPVLGMLGSVLDAIVGRQDLEACTYSLIVYTIVR